MGHFVNLVRRHAYMFPSVGKLKSRLPRSASERGTASEHCVTPAVRPLVNAVHENAEQALAQENDERLELSIAQVFVVETARDPWIAVWPRRVTTRPR